MPRRLAENTADEPGQRRIARSTTRRSRRQGPPRGGQRQFVSCFRNPSTSSSILFGFKRRWVPGSVWEDCHFSRSGRTHLRGRQFLRVIKYTALTIQSASNYFDFYRYFVLFGGAVPRHPDPDLEQKNSCRRLAPVGPRRRKIAHHARRRQGCRHHHAHRLRTLPRPRRHSALPAPGNPPRIVRRLSRTRTLREAFQLHMEFALPTATPTKSCSMASRARPPCMSPGPPST